MELSQEQKRQIIDSVLSSIHTNSRTIDHLTDIDEVLPTDYFEINRGRKASCTVVSKRITQLVSDEIIREAKELAQESKEKATEAAASAKQSAASAKQSEVSAGNAASEAAKAVTAAEKATPPTITLSELDTLGQSTAAKMVEAVGTSSHTRYKVKDGNNNVGILDVIGDREGHLVTEILTTYHTLKADGSINPVQHDCSGDPFVYFRSYNVNSSKLTDAGVAKGNWSKWHRCGEEMENTLKLLGIKVDNLHITPFAGVLDEILQNPGKDMTGAVYYYRKDGWKCFVRVSDMTTSPTDADHSFLGITGSLWRGVILERLDWSEKYTTDIFKAGNRLFYYKNGELHEIAADIAEAKNLANTANSGVSAINNKLGKPNGIAVLDANGRIPASAVPGAMDDVKEFAGMDDVGEVLFTSSDQLSTDSDCMVIYDTNHNCLVLYSTTNGWHNRWGDSHLFGTDGQHGVTPADDKVYLDTDSNKAYRWSGSQLVVIGSDLALGETTSTAFAGNRGKQLEERMMGAEQSIVVHAESIGELNNEVDACKTEQTAFLRMLENAGKRLVSLEVLSGKYPRGVVEFSYFDANGNLPSFQQASSGHSGGDDGVSVLFYATAGRFLLGVEDEGLWANWTDSEKWGTQTATGIKPYEDAIYHFPGDGRYYVWEGTTLSPVVPFTGRSHEFTIYGGNSLTEALKSLASQDILKAGDWITMNKNPIGLCISNVSGQTFVVTMSGCYYVTAGMGDEEATVEEIPWSSLPKTYPSKPTPEEFAAIKVGDIVEKRVVIYKTSTKFETVGGNGPQNIGPVKLTYTLEDGNVSSISVNGTTGTAPVLLSAPMITPSKPSIRNISNLGFGSRLAFANKSSEKTVVSASFDGKAVQVLDGPALKRYTLEGETGSETVKEAIYELRRNWDSVTAENFSEVKLGDTVGVNSIVLSSFSTRIRTLRTDMRYVDYLLSDGDVKTEEWNAASLSRNYGWGENWLSSPDYGEECFDSILPGDLLTGSHNEPGVVIAKLGDAILGICGANVYMFTRDASGNVGTERFRLAKHWGSMTDQEVMARGMLHTYAKGDWIGERLVLDAGLGYMKLYDFSSCKTVTFTVGDDDTISRTETSGSGQSASSFMSADEASEMVNEIFQS